MSCVTWHIGIYGGSPVITVEPSDTPEYIVSLSNPINTSVEVAETARVDVGILGASPKFRIGIECKPGLERWLEVTPDEPAWLTEDNDWSFDYEVSSNLMWTIE